MNFSAEREMTLDNSVPIIIRHLSESAEEYIFQFALNEKEILQLQKELRKALKTIRCNLKEGK